MRVGLAYTSTTPELIGLVESEVKKQLGSEVEIISRQDPGILEEIRKLGYVSSVPGAQLMKMYLELVLEGVDGILNICSSVGEAADAMQDAARYLGIPIVRIDEEMCREAVRHGKRIAVMATLPTTLEPTKNTIHRVAREMGKKVETIDVLVEGAFGLDQENFKKKMAEYAEQAAEKSDVILFAQGSMAYCEEYIADLCHKEVLSSPRFGAAALRQALVGKGVKIC